MRVENILVKPAENGVQISNVFLSFINKCIHNDAHAAVPLIKSEDSEILSRVAERKEKQTKSNRSVKYPKE